MPSSPGLSLPLVYYHNSAGEDARAEFTIGPRIVAALDAQADLLFMYPTVAFSPKIFGAQLALTMGFAVGGMQVDAGATLSAPAIMTRGASVNDGRGGISDLYPMASLKWNFGNDNLMVYTMGGVPVGTYNANRLSNIGTNHWSIDAGGGYTYFDHLFELSAAMGFTYNFENPDTNYQNGVDMHVDWAGSAIFAKAFHAGPVGYFYEQLSADSGEGAKLGPFRSRVGGVGVQIGAFLPLLNRIWYANLKGFYEYYAEHRPDGWNMWLTFSLPLIAPKLTQQHDEGT